jgi:predicted permease
MGSAVVGLASALLQIFSLIGVGYALTTFNLITKDAGSGIGQLVGKVALPSLLFKGLATADLGAVDFNVIGAVVLSKAVVQLAAFAVGYQQSHGTPQRLTRGGVFGETARSAMRLGALSSTCKRAFTWCCVLLPRAACHVLWMHAPPL